MTDINKIAGWVLFDADCRFCRTLADRFGPLLRRRHLDLVPLQTPGVRERLGLNDTELLAEMRLLTPTGVVYGGADALLSIARQIWWARPVCWLAGVPGVTPALRKAYAWFARHRYCLGRTCTVAFDSKRRSAGTGWLKWFPAFALPVLAIVLGRDLPGWVCMWLMSMTMFFGAKWLTLSRMLFAEGELRLLAYLFLWPGMDPKAFFGVECVPRPPFREWVLALAKVFFGAALLWVGISLTWTTRPLVAGWVGMIGLVLLLHFGLFHLLSLFWRARGINARPIMDSPGAAASLASFWGKGWNTAFADLMREHCFNALARHLGTRPALLAIFFISGLVHELVISLPAHGGYGLPTLYFMLQGLGLLVERSQFGRELGLGSGWRGRCYVALVTVGPVFVLFHPIFVRQVILPMLCAIRVA